MAGTDIAIDLGSANFRLYVDGKGVVVDEPNVIAVDEDSNRVVAVGRRAYKMLGRTSDRVRVVKPVTGGVISDLTLMDATLQHYLKKVTNSRVFMPRAVVAVPSGITEVERRAVVDAVAANGIRKVCLIEAPVAAAIGAGLDMSPSARQHGRHARRGCERHRRAFDESPFRKRQHCRGRRGVQRGYYQIRAQKV